MTISRPIEYPRGNVRLDGLTCKNADINSHEMTIDETATTHTFRTLQPNSELVKLLYNISETFDGALKLGNASDDDAYIEDAAFPKSGSGVITLGVLLTDTAVIKLKVSGCTTGAGWFKLVWGI